jgi:DNA-directed RNA polymerase specialized sigma24 family protein
VDHVDTEDPGVASPTAEQQVTSLYQAHALSLARLALVMLGDAAAAEDVVQDAFLDLTEEQTADAMRVSRGTVKSATSRAIAAVGRMIGAPANISKPGEGS